MVPSFLPSSLAPNNFAIFSSYPREVEKGNSFWRPWVGRREIQDRVEMG
jgi:hypothetical protein